MELIKTVLSALVTLGLISSALSGAILAIERDMDIFGVLFLGMTTALGGGVLRDILIGRLPPAMFTSFYYIVLSLGFALATFLLVRLFTGQYIKHKERICALVNLIDAIGLAAFSIMGVQGAFDSGLMSNGFLCVFLGMTTGVGGGVMRDIMSARIPVILRKRVYATASVLCSLIYYLMIRLGVNSTLSIIFCMVQTCTIRWLSTKYKWNLPHAIPQDRRERTPDNIAISGRHINIPQ